MPPGPDDMPRGLGAALDRAYGETTNPAQHAALAGRMRAIAAETPFDAAQFCLNWPVHRRMLAYLWSQTADPQAKQCIAFLVHGGDAHCTPS